jgi:DNA-binding NarL/FixJ family response regulator
VPGWVVAGEAANGREAVELAAALKPDLVILDLTMPELNGLEAARKIISAEPAARVLILTAHESEQLVREVLSAGAQGYVLKSDAGRILVAALQALLDGGTAICAANPATLMRRTPCRRASGKSFNCSPRATATRTLPGR